MDKFDAFSQRLAGFLMMKGFVIQSIRKDAKSNRNVFVFNNGEELQKAIKEYQNLKMYK